MRNTSYFTIAETIESYRKKEISPVENVRAHIQRAQRLQSKLNCFSHLDAESAIARAQQAEAAILLGEALLPLSGVPLSIKSNIDVAGWPCPAGSLLRKDYVPSTNATIVSRLEAAGAILLGNTNTPEFLMAYETDNLLNGKTSNPWNLAYSPGGSSGGEAAAIASGCSTAGVGSDGGGSIRVPAHFCGICGLKPTPGRIASTGHFPPGAGALNWLGVVGPMARTVADLRVLFSVLAGPDPGDALSAPLPVRFPDTKSVQGTRVGMLESAALGTATAETCEAVNRAAGLLSQQGFSVEPISVRTLDLALDLWWFFFGPVVAESIRRSIKDRENLVSPILLGYLESTEDGPPVTLASFSEACTNRDLVRADILRQLRDVPILLSPVSSAPAFRHGEGSYRAGDPHNYRDTMRYCQWLNLAGLPGLSLPMGRSSNGLPINVQLIARPHEEELLLVVAELLEQARGAWQAPPAAITEVSG
jgi:Asp-tRNA(Asn)/Glu-tRNA(Gln) amidotransferase A subunit family amidase